MTPARWAAVAVVVLGLFFAVQGGEFSTLDYVTLRRQARTLEGDVADLRRTVDSLDRVATALEQDPKEQERVARESYGMLRSGEFLYRLVPPEAGAPGAASAGRRDSLTERVPGR